MDERIKELAEQAGFNQMGIWKTIGIHEYLERFAELVEAAAVAREREACAKLCEENMFFATGEQHAKAIRARENT
jgi:hypothetical protein